MALNIKKGDLVQVISGKDKGVKGKVIDVVPRGRARSSSRASTGSRSTPRSARTPAVPRPAASSRTEAPIHVSNVMIVDPSDGRPTRVGYRTREVEKRRTDGSTYEPTRSVRISRRTGKDI